MHPDYPNILITAAKVEPLEPIDFEPVDFEPYTNEQLDEIFSI